MSADNRWKQRPEGGGRFALWLLRSIALLFGRRLSRVLLYPITAYFLLRRGPERRASRAYLSRIHGREVGWWPVAKHIHAFASTILDRVFLLTGQFRSFEVRTEGLEELHRAIDLGRGVLLLGSHLGSFDVLRVLSLQRPDVTVRVVLDVAHNPGITQLLAALNPGLAAGVIDAGKDGTAIVLAIRDAVEQGALVTLLADRVRSGESSITAQFLGDPARFPVAPWLIGAALGVPVALCFGLYRGGNRYDMHFELLSEHLLVPRRERAQVLAGLVQQYADRLAHYTLLAPYNWFNFYDFWDAQTTADGVDHGVRKPGPAGGLGSRP